MLMLQSKTNYVYGSNPGDGNGTEKFPSSNVKVGTLKQQAWDNAV